MPSIYNTKLDIMTTIDGNKFVWAVVVYIFR